MRTIGRGIIFTLALLLAASSAQAANITAADWGTTADGGKIQLFTLTGPRGWKRASPIIGGMIVNLMVPNKQGTKTDTELGFDDAASYQKGSVFGAVIGRYVGRISHGGSFPHRRQDLSAGKEQPRRQVRHPWRHRRLLQETVAGAK